jgi:outer membrane receptor protein involved in Fe transport
VTTFTIGRGFKALLLAGGASAVFFATPAVAQDDPDCEANPNAAACRSDAPIVVTGSRIGRRDFEANSPLVSVNNDFLNQQGGAALEQSLNKLPQFVPAQTPFAGGDIQPTATNTPGAATVSLRGLGTNRNLVLIDNRRGTPGNATGTVDINTIPSAAIERVEVITGGASATYGADALAGVTNFILKKDFQGLELDGQMNFDQDGGGFEYQVSGIMGADFDDGRGNVSFAMSFNDRGESLQTDRKWYRDLYADPQVGGNQFFIEYPGVVFRFGEIAGEYFGAPTGPLHSLFPGATFPFPVGSGPTDITGLFGVTTYVDPNNGNEPFTWSFFNTLQEGGWANFNGFDEQPLRYKRTADGGAAANYTDFYLVLPLKRYNMFARGNYEINDWIGVFGQGLYSRVSTATRNQGGAIVGGWDVIVPYSREGDTGNATIYTGSQLGIPYNVNEAPNPPNFINAAGYGNPSSILLNGVNWSGGVYTDPTPGDLTDNPTNPDFSRLYATSTNTILAACANVATNPVGGCSNWEAIGQFFPQNLQDALDLRANPNAPVQLNYGIPEPRTVFTDVDTFNMTGGLEGFIPGTDWTWEAFVSYGLSTTFARQTGTFSLTRARSLLQSPGFGLGFINNSNTATFRQNVVNGVPIGFGANIATCETGFNIFLGWDGISQDCKDALKAELKNRSTVKQLIWEANTTGTLVDLPAGELRAALGASYRKTTYEFINDTITTQNASFLDQTIGIYPSIDFGASITVKELYGELLIPILRDSFIESFNLELGGRMSDYDTTGVSYTYKILADMEITDWLRLRGGYNRAERAPNIAELFLTPQQTFAFNAIGDICSQNSNYFISTNPNAPGNSASNAADVLAVCRAVMDNTGGPGTAAAYYNPGRPGGQPAAGGGFSFPTIQGNPNLQPEVADTWTAGVVFTSPATSPLLSRLRLTVDWFNIKIKNAIGVSPAGTIQRCFDAFYNPLVAGAAGNPAQALAAATSNACAGPVTALTYDPSPGLGLGRVTAQYTNEGQADISGIDAQLDWSADAGPGTINLNVVGSYSLHYKVKELANNPLVDYSGTFGTTSLGLQLGAFKWRTLTNLGYRWGGLSVGLQWQHLPGVEDSGEASQPTPNTTGNEHSYDLFSLNGSYDVTDNLTVRFVVNNLFNRAPPLTGYNVNFDNDGSNPATPNTRGGAFNANFYDTVGRAFAFGANMKF